MMEELKRIESPGDVIVPKVVANRLSLYLRELQQLIRNGNETTSSTQLGHRLGITDAQVRKDLAYFGQFGHPGVGYRCQELIVRIRAILGTDREWRVAIIGLGNLGRALLGYRGFSGQGFSVVAAFDCDVSKLADYGGAIPRFHVDQLEEVIARDGIRLAMLAVPAEAAQPVTDRLVSAGVQGILNFAPVTISVPAGVSQVAVDLAIELEQLCFAVVTR
jgi:redox-sensing transcriptional repressor